MPSPEPSTPVPNHGSSDPVSLLGALQLADSFFPSGLYTLSHGLESFIQQGWLRSPDELADLLEDYVAGMIGSADVVATAEVAKLASSGDVATIVLIDEYLASMKLAHEAALSSRRTGRSLLGLARALTDDPTLVRYADLVETDQAPGSYAVALGVLGAAWGLPPRDVALVELYSFVTGLLGAALRTMRLDHIQAHNILHRLKPRLAVLAQQASETSYHDMTSFAPAIDIMQMQHERATVRLFAS